MGILDKLESNNKKLTKISERPESASKEPPPSVIGMVDTVLDDQRQRHHFFRPSMIASCKRQNVFHYLDTPRKPQQVSNKLQRILDNGTAVHSVVQGYLERHPEFWFAPESKVDFNMDGSRIRGSCDGIFVRRTDLYRFGLEIKSINERDFKKLTAPQDKHVVQATLYAALHGVYWITILYWNKNNQDLKEFPVAFDPKRWEEIRGRVKELREYVNNKKLPPFEPTDCDLTFCAYVDACRKAGAPV